MGGYVYKTNSELYIMDTNDPKTAKKKYGDGILTD